MEKFTLTVEHGKAGLWYVTSPEIKGLLVTGYTIEGVLDHVGGAIEDLQRAARERA